MKRCVVVVDCAIGVLQAISCQHAHHSGSCRHFILAFEQTGHRGSTGWFAEHTFLPSQQLVGLDDFRIRDIQKRPIACCARGNGFLPVHWIADADRRGDGFRIGDGGLVHQWG